MKMEDCAAGEAGSGKPLAGKAAARSPMEKGMGVKMNRYYPEGHLIDTPRNQNSLRTAGGLAEAAVLFQQEIGGLLRHQQRGPVDQGKDRAAVDTGRVLGFIQTASSLSAAERRAMWFANARMLVPTSLNVQLESISGTQKLPGPMVMEVLG